MKQGIHPDYQIANVHCSCGNTFTTRSTVSEIRAELCSNCHPFYTGKQKLVDTGGRVERFQRRYAKTQAAQKAAGEELTPAVGDEPAKPAPHLYGGQAVVEGVMMRGADHWAVAVREPEGSIHVESHEIDSVARRHPILRKPFLRGIIVLGQSLAIGVRALMVASRHSLEEEEQLSSRQMGISLAIAMIFFIGVFILGPTTLFTWVEDRIDASGVVVNILEGVFRVLLFVGYLWAIGRSKEIHRVFEYHGAEHKTIAAFEHGEDLVPERIDTYPKEHVRCGTNFLIIVMVVTIFVFTLFGTPGLLWRIVSRIVAIPIIAGVAYEALRLGARFPDSIVMKVLMAPGIWLQKITTQEPVTDQIDVAVASFQEVLRREAEAAGTT